MEAKTHPVHLRVHRPRTPPRHKLPIHPQPNYPTLTCALSALFSFLPAFPPSLFSLFGFGQTRAPPSSYESRAGQGPRGCQGLLMTPSPAITSGWQLYLHKTSGQRARPDQSHWHSHKNVHTCTCKCGSVIITLGVNEHLAPHKCRGCAVNGVCGPRLQIQALGFLEFFHMSAESGLDPGEGGGEGGFRPLYPPQSSISHHQIPQRGEWSIALLIDD